MEKQRKYKLFSIVALVVAIAGMTLGFAAFSKVLTISASATVNPSVDNGGITLYGLVDDAERIKFVRGDGTFDFSKWSTTSINLIDINGNFVENSIVNINNTDFSVDSIIMNFNMVEEDQDQGIVLIAKNESENDIYFSFDDEIKKKIDSGDFSGTCTPGDGTTASYVEEQCKYINFYPTIFTSGYDEVSGLLIENEYKIVAGDYIMIYIDFYFEDSPIKADGLFTVEFDPIKFGFNSVTT